MGNSTPKKLRCNRLMMIILTMISFSAFNLKAATINVTSIAALQSAINGSASGDIINLANGHYTNNTITISKSGITVQAATPGGVFLDGNNNIVISGNSNTFSGFQFTTNNMSGGLPVESPTNAVTVTGNSNTITQLNFNGYFASKMLQISGLNNTVSYCNFQNKPTDTSLTKGGDGDMLQIIPNASNPGNNVIRYCSFQHMPGGGGDWGNECIRIGNSGNSTQISRTVVEFCYFEDTGLGDSEAISVKSRENILRYNTMNNNPEAMFVFRNGDNNVAYGNFFINSGGIRVKETNNTFCFNNYFERCGTTGSMNPVTYVYYTANSTFQLDNVNFLHNTFVDCGPIDFGGIGATNNTWANNIFKKTNSIFINPNAGTTFTGNIYFGGTLGINIPSGMTSADPQLVLNGDGYFSPSATSPVIGAASAIYPSFLNIPGVDTLMLDIKGKTRPLSRLLKDVGCEQVSVGAVTNRPLKLSDTGPSYLKILSANADIRQTNFEFKIRHNSTSNKFTADYKLNSTSRTDIILLNSEGKTMKNLLNNLQSAGFYQQEFDISGLRSGIYFVRLMSEQGSSTKKLIINQ